LQLTGNSARAFREVDNYRPHDAVIGTEVEDSRSTGFKLLYQLDLMAAKRERRIGRAPPKRFRRDSWD